MDSTQKKPRKRQLVALEKEVERLKAKDKIKTDIINAKEKSTQAHIKELDLSRSKIKQLTEDNKKLKFMVDNGLGYEDLKNDITYPTH